MIANGAAADVVNRSSRDSCSRSSSPPITGAATPWTWLTTWRRDAATPRMRATRANGSEAVPDRQGTKKDDKKAVELLATRGLDKAERARLRKLVEVALGPTATLPEQPAAQTPEARIQALTKLRDWYDEWAATARAVVKKKSYRIRIGIASRKAAVRKPKVTGAAADAKSPK